MTKLILILIVVYLCVGIAQAAKYSSYSNNVRTFLLNTITWPVRKKEVKSDQVAYGTKLVFDTEQLDKNTEFKFSDFSIRFVGETKHNNSITNYNFEITDLQRKKRKVSWSSGLGEIAPEIFVVNNNLYQLEVESSEMHTGDTSFWYYNFIVSKTKDMGLLEYILSTTAKLSMFDRYSLKDLEDVFGLDWIKSAQSDQYKDIYHSLAFSPFENIEIRVDKKDTKQKILILTVDARVRIVDTDVQSKYPGGELGVGLHDTSHTTWTIDESWGKVSFGFNKNILTSVTFDSYSVR